MKYFITLIDLCCLNLKVVSSIPAQSTIIYQFLCGLYLYDKTTNPQVLHYCQISNIGHTKFQNLNVSHLILQLSLPNPFENENVAPVHALPNTSEWSTILLPTKVQSYIRRLTVFRLSYNHVQWPMSQTFFGAHNPNLVKKSVTLTIWVYIRSDHNFAYGMTAQLSCYMQNCELTSSIIGMTFRTKKINEMISVMSS